MIKRVLYITLAIIIGLFVYQTTTMSSVINATKKAVASAFAGGPADYGFYGELLFARSGLSDGLVYHAKDPLFEVETESFRLHGYLFYGLDENDSSKSKLVLLSYFSYISNTEYSLKRDGDKSRVVIHFSEVDEQRDESLELGYHDNSMPSIGLNDLTEMHTKGLDNIFRISYFDSADKLITNVELALTISAYDEEYIVNNFDVNISSDEINKIITRYVDNTTTITASLIFSVLAVGVYIVLFRKKKQV